MKVLYQGGKPDKEPPHLPHEDYDVPDPPLNNVDVCCRTGTPIEGRLPGVRCGLPAAKHDASTHADAAHIPEAGSDARSSPGMRDASRGEGDAADDVVSIPKAGSGTEAGIGSGSAPAAIFCELWTNGPADIVVTGSTYPRLTRSLSPKLDECGAVTRDVRIIWTHVDGGR